jgi:hypothetical protein
MGVGVIDFEGKLGNRTRNGFTAVWRILLIVLVFICS